MLTINIVFKVLYYKQPDAKKAIVHTAVAVVTVTVTSTERAQLALVKIPPQHQPFVVMPNV